MSWIAFDYILLSELQPLQRNAIGVVDDVGVSVEDELNDADDVDVEKTVNDGIFWLMWSVLDECGALIMIDGRMSESGG